MKVIIQRLFFVVLLVGQVGTSFAAAAHAGAGLAVDAPFLTHVDATFARLHRYIGEAKVPTSEGYLSCLPRGLHDNDDFLAALRDNFRVGFVKRYRIDLAIKGNQALIDRFLNFLERRKAMVSTLLPDVKEGHLFKDDGEELKTLEGVFMQPDVLCQNRYKEFYEHCPFFAIFNACCFVNQESGGGISRLRFNNEEEFRRLHKIWLPLAVEATRFHLAKKVVSASDIGKECRAIIAGSDGLRAPAIQAILAAIINGKGGIESSVPENVPAFIDAFTRHVAFPSNLFLKNAEDDEDIALRYLSWKHEEANPSKRKEIEALERFRKRESSYVVVLFSNLASKVWGIADEIKGGHAFMWLFTRSAGSKARLTIANSSYGGESYTRQTGKYFYKALFENSLLPQGELEEDALCRVLQYKHLIKGFEVLTKGAHGWDDYLKAYDKGYGFESFKPFVKALNLLYAKEGDLSRQIELMKAIDQDLRERMEKYLLYIKGQKVLISPELADLFHKLIGLHTRLVRLYGTSVSTYKLTEQHKLAYEQNHMCRFLLAFKMLQAICRIKEASRELMNSGKVRADYSENLHRIVSDEWESGVIKASIDNLDGLTDYLLKYDEALAKEDATKIDCGRLDKWKELDAEVTRLTRRGILKGKAAAGAGAFS